VLKNIVSVQNINVLELWFNIDGLPVDKKGKSFWAILCNFSLEFKLTNPFIVGAYFGVKNHIVLKSISILLLKNSIICLPMV